MNYYISSSTDFDYLDKYYTISDNTTINYMTNSVSINGTNYYYQEFEDGYSF